MMITNFYYYCLGIHLRKVYDLINNGVSSLSTTIELPLVAKSELSSVYEYVLRDNPIYFYTVAFSYVTDVARQRIILRPIYRYSEEIIQQSIRVLSGCLSEFDALKDRSPFEKELYVHDYCLSNFTYDYTFREHSFSPLGLLVYKEGVCEGISRFAKIALNYLGVECMLVSGIGFDATNNKEELHTWNIVLIDGNTYHLDITFNMSHSKVIKRYDYFNLSDVEIKKDHTIIGSPPACSIVGRDYYSLNALAFNTVSDLEKHVSDCLLKGKSRIVVKLRDYETNFAPYTVDDIVSMAIRKFTFLYFQHISVEVAFNQTQHVFEMAFCP